MAVSPWAELTKRRLASYTLPNPEGNALLDRQRRGKRMFIRRGKLMFVQGANQNYQDYLEGIPRGTQPLRLAT